MKITQTKRPRILKMYKENHRSQRKRNLNLVMGSGRLKIRLGIQLMRERKRRIYKISKRRKMKKVVSSLRNNIMR
jgi:hypothetical protein